MADPINPLTPFLCECCDEGVPSELWGEGMLCERCFADMQTINDLREDFATYLRPLINQWAQTQQAKGYCNDVITAASFEVQEVLDR